MKVPIAEIGLGSPFLAVKFSKGLPSNVAQLSVQGPWVAAISDGCSNLLLSGLPDPSTHLAHPSRPQQEVKKSLCDTYLQWRYRLEADIASHN